MRNGRIQASYIHANGRRYYAPSTFTAKMDAEGWLSNERKLIELDEWTPPRGPSGRQDSPVDHAARVRGQVVVGARIMHQRRGISMGNSCGGEFCRSWAMS